MKETRSTREQFMGDLLRKTDARYTLRLAVEPWFPKYLDAST
jgi:hypothetical protein